MLSVDNICSFYDSTQVLFGMSLEVSEGEIVTLLGRNGMGKTTTIRSIMGLLRPQSGAIHFQGQDITGLPPYKVAHRGLGLCPEGRHIFPSLTVLENLLGTASNRNSIASPWSVERVLHLFPSLEPRLKVAGGRISGGEQQMLSIGRALMTNPKLLLLDEATEGLSPRLRKEIWRSIVQLKKNRQSILIVDKNLESLLDIADQHYIIEKGHCVWSGSSVQLRKDTQLQQKYIGI